MLIPKDLLAITKLAPKPSGNYSNDRFAGVLVERRDENTVRIVETNGYQLIVAEYKDLSASYPTIEFDASGKAGFKAMLPSKLVEEAGKTIPTKTDLPVLENLAINENPNGKIQLATTDLETTRKFETKATEYNYPMYESCIPEKEEGVEIGVDAELLAKTLQTIAAMQGDVRIATVRLILKDSNSPLIIKAENIDHNATLTGLVMPCCL